MPGAAYPLRMLQTISGHLRDRGFKGNSEDYYDPGGRPVPVCWAGDDCVLGRRCLCAGQTMPVC